MAHEIFNTRFWSDRDEWHGINANRDLTKGLSASEAWNKMTPFSLGLHNLKLEGLEDIPSGFRAIVRYPVPDDPTPRPLGVVGMEYILVDPLEVCEIFDRAVQHPVETLGALGKGETFFVTVKLPTIGVRGDEVENYLLIISPHVGNATIEARITPVRTVCKNTLIAAKAQTTELFKFTHTKGIQRRVENWMTGVYQRAERQSETLSQFFNILVEYKVSTPMAMEFSKMIYPEPVKPTTDTVIEDLLPIRVREWEELVRNRQKSRTAVHELFTEKGTGLMDPAVVGTGWAYYNAVAEWESWKRTTNRESRLVSLLSGDRADKIEKAYSVVLESVLANR